MFYKKILNFEIFYVKTAKLVKTILHVCRIFSHVDKPFSTEEAVLIETGT
jgi:hypothetical protein